jgi:hypothetical protein
MPEVWQEDQIKMALTMYPKTSTFQASKHDPTPLNLNPFVSFGVMENHILLHTNGDLTIQRVRSCP